MNEKRPRPRHAFLLFGLSIVLIFLVGAPLQRWNRWWGLFFTEVVLILGVTFLMTKLVKADLREVLRLKRVGAISLIIAALIPLPVMVLSDASFRLVEYVLGTYPSPERWTELLPHNLGMLGFLTFLYGVLPATCEEVLHRGFMLKAFENAWSPHKAVIVSGVLFGLYHIDPWRIPGALIMGLIVAYIVVRSQSLILAVTTHFVYNVLPFLVFYVVGKEIIEIITFDIPDLVNVGAWTTALAALLIIWKKVGDRYV